METRFVPKDKGVMTVMLGPGITPGLKTRANWPGSTALFSEG